jgi:hypothetical protein
VGLLTAAATAGEVPDAPETDDETDGTDAAAWESLAVAAFSGVLIPVELLLVLFTRSRIEVMAVLFAGESLRK